MQNPRAVVSFEPPAAPPGFALYSCLAMISAPPAPPVSPVSRPHAVLLAVTRLLLGLGLLVTGLSGVAAVLGWPVPVAPVPFMHLLVESGFLLPAKLVEALAGALLLLNRWPRLALVLEAPVAFNVVLFHLCFDRANLWMGGLLLVLLAVLAWPHRSFFAAWLGSLLRR